MVNSSKVLKSKSIKTPSLAPVGKKGRKKGGPNAERGEKYRENLTIKFKAVTEKKETLTNEANFLGLVIEKIPEFQRHLDHCSGRLHLQREFSSLQRYFRKGR